MTGTVTVRLPAYDPQDSSGEKALTISFDKPRKTVTVVMPWIPDEIERAGFARAWEQIPRPGRKPVAVARGRSLRTFTFTCLLADPDLALPVTRHLEALEDAADTEQPVTAKLGGRTFGQVTISGLSVRETEWDSNAEPLEAVVAIELTEASDVPASIGPVPHLPRLSGKASGMARKARS